MEPGVRLKRLRGSAPLDLRELSADCELTSCEEGTTRLITNSLWLRLNRSTLGSS
jgi:hypothetical protein